MHGPNEWTNSRTDVHGPMNGPMNQCMDQCMDRRTNGWTSSPHLGDGDEVERVPVRVAKATDSGVHAIAVMAQRYVSEGALRVGGSHGDQVVPASHLVTARAPHHVPSSSF